MSRKDYGRTTVVSQISNNIIDTFDIISTYFIQLQYYGGVRSTSVKDVFIGVSWILVEIRITLRVS